MSIILNILNSLKLIRYSFFLIFLLNLSISFSQKNDYIWEISTPDISIQDSTSVFGGTKLDFHYDPVRITFDWQIRSMDVIGTNAIYNDAEGNYRCMTNRTWIANRDHKPMKNGDPIFQDILGQNAYMFGLGTNHPQGVLFLPWPDKPDSVFLITQNYKDKYGESLGYCLIDINAEGGKGAVVSEEFKVWLNEYRLGYLTATRHANGRDWWLLCPGTEANKIYTFLVSPDGIDLTQESNIGLLITANQTNGQAKFSPDGSQYAILESEFNSDIAMVHLFDFDRCTGILSSQKTDTIPSEITELGHGLTFSYSGNNLYVNTAYDLFQYDLKDNDVSHKTFIQAYDGAVESYPAGDISILLGYTALGPDGMIYMCTASSVSYLHRIRAPEKEGTECNFVQRDFKIKSNFQSIPNFVNYRLGALKGSACDTLGIVNGPVARFTTRRLLEQGLKLVDLSFYNPTTYTWSLNGIDFSSISDPDQITIDTTVDNTICLIVSNEFGADTLCKTIKARLPSATVDYSELDIQVFPNPNSGIVFLKTDPNQISIGQIKVSDINGNIILTKSILDQVTKLDFSDSASGVYFISIQDEYGRVLHYSKVIKI